MKLLSLLLSTTKRMRTWKKKPPRNSETRKVHRKLRRRQELLFVFLNLMNPRERNTCDFLTTRKIRKIYRVLRQYQFPKLRSSPFYLLNHHGFTFPLTTLRVSLPILTLFIYASKTYAFSFCRRDGSNIWGDKGLLMASILIILAM